MPRISAAAPTLTLTRADQATRGATWELGVDQLQPPAGSWAAALVTGSPPTLLSTIHLRVWQFRIPRDYQPGQDQEEPLSRRTPGLFAPIPVAPSTRQASTPRGFAWARAQNVTAFREEVAARQFSILACTS